MIFLRLLLRHTDGASTAPSRLGVLATHAKAPEVSQAAVSADLLETLEILANLAVESVGHDLRILAVLDVLLSVEEPIGDLVLARVRHDRYHLLHLILSQLPGSLARIHARLLADNVRVATTDTLDGC